MPSPLVGTVPAPRPLLPPPSSSSSPFPPMSLDGLLFASSSALDTQLLTQALTRELSSCTKDSPSPSLSSSSSSSKSSADLHSQFVQGARMNRLLPQKQQDGIPTSNTWVCKDKPESPLNTGPSGISSIQNISPTKSIGNQSYEGVHGSTILDPMETTQSGIWPTQASTKALSSQASAGAGSTKVSKRRSRANKKPPITVLSASTSNFRAMVQQLTGIPMPDTSSNLWSTPGVSILKPQPTRVPYSGGIFGLPTLDTSASLLGRNWSQVKAPAYDLPFSQRLPQASVLAGSHMAGKSENASHIFNYDTMLSYSSSPLTSLWDAMDSGSHLKGQVKPFPINGLFNESHNTMGSKRPYTSMETSSIDDHYSKVAYNTVDSWLAFDGGALASPSPRVEVANVASN